MASTEDETLTAKFLAAGTFAVAGASRDSSKYGSKVFRALVASGRTVYPLNPSATEIDSHRSYKALSDLPSTPESLSIITPPHVTRTIVQQAIAAGVKNLWMQPGAGDAEANQEAVNAGLKVIDDGSCILVLLATEQK